MQEARSSGIDPRLLPGISQSVFTSAFRTGDPSYLPQTPPRSSLLRDRPKAPPSRLPECFDLCVQDRRSQLPAPDSSKKLSSPGSTQDSSQVSLRSVLTSAFRTGDPSYLPQTPPRSSLLRDRPKTPPRYLSESFGICFKYRRSRS
ncbi:uncharacterized protein ACIBXB_000634 [Morphnus guianensis]